MLKIAIQLAVLFSLLPAVFSTGLPPAQGSPFQPVDCASFDARGLVDGQDVSCGYLTVPADHDRPEGPTLKLAVAILKHTGKLAQPEPLFVLQGGPGGSTLETHPFLVQRSTLLEHFDVVLLEQRGTLYSQPSLVCDEAYQYVLDHLNTNLPSEEYDRLWDQALSACRARLVAQGLQLSNFDSIENAKDVEALRRALKYETIDLYGVSYGSLLALHYLRLFPAGLHAVVLDGVVPAQSNYIYTNVIDQDRVFKALFAACNASRECADAYPELETVFFQLVDDLEKTPAHIVLHDQESGKDYDGLVDGETFYTGIYQAFYSAEFIPAIPRMIYQARERDFTGFKDLLSFIYFDRSMSYGMYYSVNCAEEADTAPAPLDLSEVFPTILKFSRDDAQSFLATCRAWDVETLGPEVNRPVESDVPVLLLSGGFDPVTPERNATLAADTLSHSYTYTIPTGGHGQAFSNPCADEIILAFLRDPSEAPDSACIADYAAPAFWGRGALVPLSLFGRAGQLDKSLLWPGLLLVVFSLGLASALFLLPLVWLIKLFRPKRLPAVSAEAPDVSDGAFRPAELALRFAGPAAMLNGLVIPLFWIALTAVFLSMVLKNDMMLFWGVAASLRALFLLPLLSACLTALMVAETFLGWASRGWSVWRKLYYSFLTACAIGCTALAVYLDVVLPLFR